MALAVGSLLIYLCELCKCLTNYFELSLDSRSQHRITLKICE